MLPLRKMNQVASDYFDVASNSRPSVVLDAGVEDARAAVCTLSTSLKEVVLG